MWRHFARYVIPAAAVLLTVSAESAHAAETAEAPHAIVFDAHSVQLLIGYCLLIALASVGGGALPLVVTLTHTRMQLIISFVGGLMLGIGIFHMLPHAMQDLQSADQCAFWMMMGILSMFFLIRAFHFHDHGVAEATTESLHLPAGHEHHDHDHDHDNGQVACAHSHHPMSWIGIAAGLTVHTLIDGIALAASVHSGAGRSGAVLSLFGAGTFLAILLHKPLDAVSITSLMTAGGWSRRWQMVVNGVFGAICPIGCFVFYIGVSRFAGEQAETVGCILAFAAGVFICIALSDLLPEMEFHSHSRVSLTLALLAGIAAAWAVSRLEPDHVHEHKKSGAKPSPRHVITSSESDSSRTNNLRNSARPAARG